MQVNFNGQAFSEEDIRRIYEAQARQQEEQARQQEAYEKFLIDNYIAARKKFGCNNCIVEQIIDNGSIKYQLTCSLTHAKLNSTYCKSCKAFDDTDYDAQWREYERKKKEAEEKAIQENQSTKSEEIAQEEEKGTSEDTEARAETTEKVE